ncbi:MAG: hypothetical protein ATN31_04120 [Candidatus Epulonipiscioides saccharophilum]|nr:MAG: hypothetical protein ATN31_04120 [Epulopiscium sp. AS2M-Bin001]
MIVIIRENQELVFGLDIGTRTIIGIVGYKRGNKFVVIKSALKEHEERAMIDGQVHDVSKVAYTVNCVKEEIEKSIGRKLTEVSIAAAGRVLNTQVVEFTKEYNHTILFNKSYVDELESLALKLAAKNLEEELRSSSENYDCVGYSVITYMLENQSIIQLEGQSGKSASVKLIATFLPKVVMESLREVTKRVGLTVAHSTLEPIAAITAVIPINLRVLNLALVDVGAGTSDIAITNSGSVLSYGMIPFAGDEITEVIAQRYLLDFNVADKVKKDLANSTIIEFHDIINRKYKISSKEILDLISPIVTNLATLIVDKIIELNGGVSPRVIFCIGGSSQVVGLTEKIAERAKIDIAQVTIRSGEQVEGVIDEKKEVCGPQVITPYGICLVGANENITKSINIIVNGEHYELKSDNKFSVVNVMDLDDFKNKSLFATKGESLIFTLDGREIILRGEFGIPGEILLNGKITSLDSEIKSGDQILIKFGVQGKNATKKIKDYIKDPIVVYIEDNEITLPIFMKDGDVLDSNYDIKTGDKIISMGASNLKELITMYKGSKIDTIYVNGELADQWYILEDNDIITTKGFFEKKKEIPVEPELITPDLSYTQTKTFTNPRSFLNADGKIGKTIDVRVNGKLIKMRGMDEYMFVNVFDYIDFDLNAKRGNIELRLNGGDVSFTQILKNGDNIEIFWQT